MQCIKLNYSAEVVYNIVPLAISAIPKSCQLKLQEEEKSVLFWRLLFCPLRVLPQETVKFKLNLLLYVFIVLFTSRLNCLFLLD